MDKNKRYSFLLLGLILIFALSPISKEIPGGHFITFGLGVWILVASLFAIKARTRRLPIITSLGVLSLLAEVARVATESPATVIVSLGFQIPFFVLITWALFTELFDAKRVSTDTILGAISVYFLLGLTWGFIYETIELCLPGSFTHTAASQAVLSTDEMVSSFFYYSFVTMTTVGYGDIAPVHPVARSFAMLQGVAGQMYIAILVAKLVALHILESRNDEKD